MSASRNHQGIIELPRHQRLAPVGLLRDLDRPGTRDEIEGARNEEIRARVKADDEGVVVGVPSPTRDGFNRLRQEA
jgi:hypothetical protein